MLLLIFHNATFDYTVNVIFPATTARSAIGSQHIDSLLDKATNIYRHATVSRADVGFDAFADRHCQARRYRR